MAILVHQLEGPIYCVLVLKSSDSTECKEGLSLMTLS